MKMRLGLSLLSLFLGNQALLGECRESVDDVDCVHGEYNESTNKCDCFENWRIAGVTDPTDFYAGRCEQFKCQSDEMCRQALPDVPNPRCKVHHWNCYCGWGYAFHNGWHGYEVGRDQPGGGKCMGALYTFAVWSSTGLWKFLSFAWIPILIVAAVLLPFGRKRAICDHNMPSLWNYVRACLCISPICRGECVLNPEYTLDSFKDDIAWSIYILELGIWMYIFITIFCFTIVWICSMIFWVVIVLILLVLVVASVCSGEDVGDVGDCCEGRGGCEGCQCDCSCMREFCHRYWDVSSRSYNNHPCCCRLACGCCDACWDLCLDICDTSPRRPDEFRASGTFPHDSVWGYLGHGTRRPGGGDHWSCCCCDSRNKAARCLCGPIARMIYVFPVAPENAWGGLLGLSCRHLFCRECSTQMLTRRMPCPLCRSASSTVLRGDKYDGPPPSTSDESESTGDS